MEPEQSIKVAALNDAFRRAGLGVTITAGVQVLPDLYGLMEEVRRFDNWTAENDPYEEHDFGQIMWGSTKVLWKIDYYDPRLCRWEDPVSPRCTRILTVMLASEY